MRSSIGSEGPLSVRGGRYREAAQNASRDVSAERQFSFVVRGLNLAKPPLIASPSPRINDKRKRSKVSAWGFG
jgi:hypothetical protein